MDYPNQARLKILGEVRIIDNKSDPKLMAQLNPDTYDARVERGIVIRVAFHRATDLAFANTN